MSENPLAQYFRTPAIHVTLPSQGKFYPNGSLDMPESGELEVYPMTAVDEITYRTPDALFNGSAIPAVIASCVPGIKDPWAMPAMDLGFVLTAIRIASFGHELETESKCPKCETVNNYIIDCRNIMEQLSNLKYENTIPIGDLVINLRPMTYKEVNENSKINFEEQQLARLVKQGEDLSVEKKLELVSNAFKKVTAFTIQTLAKNIANIEMPGATVDNPEHILEFLRSCDREIYNAIKKHIISERGKSEIKPFHIKCDNCGHEYEQPFTLDMSHFFE